MNDNTRQVAARREETEAKLQNALTLAVSAGEKVSISSIARASGVSPSLVHTKYPTIAAKIRAYMGVAKRDEVELLRVQLTDQVVANRQLRAEVAQLRGDLAAVASVNAALKHEISVLKATEAGKVATLRGRN